MKPRYYLLSFLFLSIIYFGLVNAIYFLPIVYDTTEGTIDIGINEDIVIFEKWTKKVSVKISLISGGPITLIHQVISDDFSDDISQVGNYSYEFHTTKIRLATSINSTSARVYYKILDYTSPLLPKVDTWDIPLEAYFLLMGNAIILYSLICGSLLIILVIKYRESLLKYLNEF